MSVQVKICGIRDVVALQTAVIEGASLIGFNFCPASKNYIEAEEAARLADMTPADVTKVGLFADADDMAIKSVLADVPLDLLQLHGSETPERVNAIKHMTGLPVMKALRLKNEKDFARIAAYDAVADRLLFDSRSAESIGESGGTLDWARLKDVKATKPWMLAGGLTAQNVAAAVEASGATAVDVSSGVESAPGVKNADKIREFLAAASRV